MEKIKNWFLIMLFLHRQVVPGSRGGNPDFYGLLLLRCEGGVTSPFALLDGERVLGERGKEIAQTLSNVRKAMKEVRPPLVSELPRLPSKKRSSTPVLFCLTPEGEQEAAKLVSAISEKTRGEIRSTLAEAILGSSRKKRAHWQKVK
jgi:hypothetical protein